MVKKQTPSADEVLETYEQLEAQGKFDDLVGEAIAVSKFKAKLARIPSTFDKPLTVGAAIALIELVIEWYESRGGNTRRTVRRR